MVRLTEIMKQRMALSSRSSRRRQRREWKIFRVQSSICARTSRIIFPVHTAQAAETSERTEKYR